MENEKLRIKVCHTGKLLKDVIPQQPVPAVARRIRSAC